MIATDRKKQLAANGGEGLMAYRVKYRKDDAVTLYNKIVKSVSECDSVEIRVRADGSLYLLKVKKESEDIHS